MLKLHNLQKDIENYQGSAYLHLNKGINDLEALPLPVLQSLQTQLKSDTEKLEKVSPCIFKK